MTAPVPVPDVAALCDHLEQLRAAATDGPWTVGHGGEIDAGRYDTVIGRGDVDCMSYCYGGTSTIEGDNLDADAALIVALVNATPTLIAAARERDRLRDAAVALRPAVAPSSVAEPTVGVVVDPVTTTETPGIATSAPRTAGRVLSGLPETLSVAPEPSQGLSAVPSPTVAPTTTASPTTSPATTTAAATTTEAAATTTDSTTPSDTSSPTILPTLPTLPTDTSEETP